MLLLQLQAHLIDGSISRLVIQLTLFPLQQDYEEDVSFPWEDFAVPELESFLQVLTTEQETHTSQVSCLH